MKKMFLTSFLMALSFSLCAQVPDGLSCENAIPIDSTFSGKIDVPGVYYFTAWTYDLPLTCYFYPVGGDVQTLYLDVDFSCDGVYDDPKIQELVDATLGWGIEMPVRFDSFDKGMDEDGRTYYSLSVDAVYRELMAAFGVSHNVQAVVKVTTSSAGDIFMAPDTTFRSCIDQSIWLNLPDVVYAGVDIADETFVLPLIDWDNDSIRFRWTGKEASVQVWIGENCDFNLSTNGENCAIDYFELKPDAGNGENVYEMTQQMIRDMINMFGKGGLFYARILSTEKAGLAIEKKPATGVMAEAIRLDLDQPVAVMAKDARQIYYFPAEWKKRGLEFISSIKTPIDVYVSKSLQFEASEEDPNVIDVFKFQETNSGAHWQMSKEEMNNLCSTVDEEFVYVKFVSRSATSITPLRWNMCDCVQKSYNMQPDDRIYIKAKTSSAIYRVHYDSWIKSNVSLTWNAFDNMKAYLVDTCAGFSLRPTNDHVLLYNEFSVNEQGNDSLIFTAQQMMQFANSVDEDGYLYFRFDAKSDGELILKRTYSEDTPEPEVPNSALLVLDSTINLIANTIDTIYHFTQDWSDISVEFVANNEDTVLIFAYFAATENVNEVDYMVAYPFSITKEYSRLQLSATELRSLLRVDQDEKIYVAFVADQDVQVTPLLWNACACVEKSYNFAIDGTETIAARSHNVIYRVNYNHWKDYDVSLHWAGNSILWAYLAYTCDFNMAATNMYVLNSSDVDMLPMDSMVIGAEVREKAIDHGLLPSDGFLYFRFYTEEEGILQVQYYPINPDTSVDDVFINEDRKSRIYCTPEGVLYIMVDGVRYTILGNKL